MAMSEPVDLFYSYAHKDKDLRDELAAQLSVLERKGVLRGWHDRRIEPGQDWDAQIDTHLKSADVILLLVSADFMNSDYIWGNELTVAMARSASGEASVVPVLVRPCLMDEAPFASLQGLPTDLKAVTSWPNRDEAWVDVAKGIRRLALAMQARLPPAPEPPPPWLPSSPGLQPAPVLPPDFVLPSPAAESPPTPPTQRPPPRPNVPVPPMSGGPPGFPTAATSAVPVPAADPTARRIDALVERFNDEMQSASQARGGVALDLPAASRAAHALIDHRAAIRVLWVDDQPDGNRLETAALRKLQIEVVAVTGTEQALARIESDADEPFDLVLSDWARPGEAEVPAGTSAGVWLLRELRRRGDGMPVVFYHGEFDPQRRAARHAVALQEGAFGEAVLPGELLQLVCAALAAR